ncbi:unnamed protein product [Camellia sinensis]
MMVPASGKKSDFDPVISALLDPIIQICEQAAEAHKSKGAIHSFRRNRTTSDPSQLSKSSVDAILANSNTLATSQTSETPSKIFLINCLCAIQQPLLGHGVASEYVKKLGTMIDNHMNSLVEKEVGTILRRWGLSNKMSHFQNSLNSEEILLAEMEDTSPTALSEYLKAFFGLILGSESSLPEFEQMQVPKLRSETCIQVARSLAEAYELIYKAIMDPKCGISSPMHWAEPPGMYQSKTTRNKALIMRRLINLKLKNGVSVAEHTSEFHSLVNQLASIKMELEDEMQALLLLSSLPDSWETLVVSLSNSAPEGKLTMGMVTDALFNEEARKKEMEGEQSHALVTESRGRDRERGRGRGRSKSKGRSQSRQDNMRRCFYCDQEDHVIRDCPEKKADRQAKEKAKGHGGPSTTAVAVHSSDDEEVMLTISSELETPGWILDSGCTFHICADKKLFSTYRRVSGSTIRMANNTVNRVVGIGTVLNLIS